MDKNILLKIAYDGAGFHGWQRQPDKPTVQGHLETVLSRLFKTGSCSTEPAGQTPEYTLWDSRLPLKLM